MEQNMVFIGGRIITIRQQLKLEPASFAKLLDVSLEKVTQWEAGELQPTAEETERIAKISRVSEDIILHGHFAEVFFDQDFTHIPKEYAKVADFISIKDFKESYRYIQKHQISMGNKKKIKEVIVQLMQKTEDRVKEQSKKQIPYILNELTNDQKIKKAEEELLVSCPPLFDTYKNLRAFIRSIKACHTDEDLFDHYPYINQVARHLINTKLNLHKSV